MEQDGKYEQLSKGRTFIRRKALGEKIRCVLVDKIVSQGGDIVRTFFQVVSLI